MKVSLNENLLSKARELGIEISAAAENGLAQQEQQEYQHQLKVKIDAAMDWRNACYGDDSHPADEFSDV